MVNMSAKIKYLFLFLNMFKRQWTVQSKKKEMTKCYFCAFIK